MVGGYQGADWKGGLVARGGAIDFRSGRERILRGGCAKN